jgi:hypothetical protein
MTSQGPFFSWLCCLYNSQFLLCLLYNRGYRIWTIVNCNRCSVEHLVNGGLDQFLYCLILFNTYGVCLPARRRAYELKWKHVMLHWEGLYKHCDGVVVLAHYEFVRNMVLTYRRTYAIEVIPLKCSLNRPS